MKHRKVVLEFEQRFAHEDIANIKKGTDYTYALAWELSEANLAVAIFARERGGIITQIKRLEYILF